MVDALSDAVRARGVPFLGICVGMQLLAERRARVRRSSGPRLDRGRGRSYGAFRFRVEDPAYGLERAAVREARILVRRHRAGRAAYFVHSYVFEPRDKFDVLATSDYGGAFTAAVGRDNIVGTQFHPEKSQAAGLALLGNFLGWTP